MENKEHLRLLEILEELREMRNKHQYNDIRLKYNTVCDSLDILQSRIYQNLDNNEQEEKVSSESENKQASSRLEIFNQRSNRVNVGENDDSLCDTNSKK